MGKNGKMIFLKLKSTDILGQIRFLVSWSKNEDNYDLNKFSQYKELVKTIFESNGLKSELFLMKVIYSGIV